MCQSQNKGGTKTTTTGFVDFPTQCQRQDNSDEDRIELAQFLRDPVPLSSFSQVPFREALNFLIVS